MRFDRIVSRLDDVMSKLSGLPGLSGLALPSNGNGGIPVVYKAIVVTVMAIVACGTLVTFGTAKAQDVPTASSGAQIPAASEANPVVEGQPLPAGLDPSLLASSPLLSTIDLTDAASAADSEFGSADDDDDAGSDKNKKARKAAKKAVQRTTGQTTTRTNGSTGSSGGSTGGNTKSESGSGDGGGGQTTSPPQPTTPPPPPPQPEPENNSAQEAYEACVHKWGILHPLHCSKP